MKNFIYFAAVFFTVVACTIDKTDYEAETDSVVPDKQEFKEVFSFEQEQYRIYAEALDGKLYKGYNEIRLHMVNTSTKQEIEDATITFLPVRTTTAGKKESCPNVYQLKFQPQEKYYKGYSVFTEESTTGKWEVFLHVSIGKQHFEQIQPLVVLPQGNMNLNMTSFTGHDQEQYLIALISPIKPKVAENKLTAGIFKYNTALEEATADVTSLQHAYTLVENYKLFLDPRMPEPSMGNHSSPNNRDLIQGEDSLYHGVVNYTMTGNWTLNFILQNNQGRILKGTKVPTDFTPGVEGVKSELFIDILF